jgi:hypothetical protein
MEGVELHKPLRERLNYTSFYRRYQVHKGLLEGLSFTSYLLSPFVEL